MKRSFVLIIAIFALLSCKNDINSLINNGKELKFSKQIISSKIDFTNSKNKYTQLPGVEYVVVKSPITFINCTFEDTVKAYFVSKENGIFCDFEQPVVFLKCKFKKPVVFNQATFRKSVIFANCMFEDVVFFQGCTFIDKIADFKENNYDTSAFFNNSTFYGYANFFKSNFIKNVNFDYINVSQVFTIASSQFEQKFSCSYSIFKDRFIASYSVFKQNAHLSDNLFFGRAEIFKFISKKQIEINQNIFYNKFIVSEATIDGNFEMKYNKFVFQPLVSEKINFLNTSQKQIDSNTVWQSINSNFFDKKDNK